MDLTSIKDIKALLTKHGFRFSKSMGQNFLTAAWVPERIARESGASPGTGVLEIGPGIGCLTSQLASRADRVVAVELDRSLLPVLDETLADCTNVEVISGDILKTDIPALVQEKFPGLVPVACANLPYNITSPAITALLEAGCFQTITVMVQREVAKRICASPGDKDYGAFTVFCQYHAKTEHLFDVPSSCFIPAPKVTSSVIRLTPCPPPDGVTDESFFFKTVRAAFGQRRKTLVNSLYTVFGNELSKDQISSCIVSCGLPPDIRGEKLSIPDFISLSAAVVAACHTCSLPLDLKS